MIKIISMTLLLIFLAGNLVACAPEQEESVPIQTETPEPEMNHEKPSYEHPSYKEYIEVSIGDGIPDKVGTPISFTGTAAIDFAGKEDMERHPDSLRFSRIEESIWMMFSFEVAVSDVVFVGISSYFDEEFDFWLYEVGELWFEAGDLSAGQPIFIQTFGHFGTLPAQAIGFTYADGVRYYIPFDQSMKDGSLALHKQSAFTFNR